MKLEILLPYQVFLAKTDVTRIVVESRQGSFGLLPRRLDCVMALVPGILLYETEAQGEVCVAVDQGVLVKTGRAVSVSVRRALGGGTDLARLRETVEREFLSLSEDERSMRQVMAQLEAGFIRRLEELRHG